VRSPRPSDSASTISAQLGERKRVVAAGYDRLGDAYGSWAEKVEGDPRNRFLAEFTRRLDNGARVLDLGCGTGVPSTRALAERFDVSGVDVSERQIASARLHVPEATFIHGDLVGVELPDASFDGIAALYSISHIPREEHPRLFARVARWLVPGGLFLATLGARDSPDWTGEWLGVPMFFSSYDAARNRSLLRTAGFTLLLDETIEMQEPEGPVTFLWVLGRKRSINGRSTA
jgi:SAM-dependent methyltransferase